MVSHGLSVRGTDNTNPRKNSEVSTDSDSNAYHVWTGVMTLHVGSLIQAARTGKHSHFTRGCHFNGFPQTDRRPGQLLSYLGSGRNAQ